MRFQCNLCTMEKVERSHLYSRKTRKATWVSTTGNLSLSILLSTKKGAVKDSDTFKLKSSVSKELPKSSRGLHYCNSGNFGTRIQTTIDAIVNNASSRQENSVILQPKIVQMLLKLRIRTVRQWLLRLELLQTDDFYSDASGRTWYGSGDAATGKRRKI